MKKRMESGEEVTYLVENESFEDDYGRWGSQI